MKRFLLLAVMLLSLVTTLSSTQQTIVQVTLGAGATQLSTSSIPCREIVIQDNAAHSMRIGDNSVTSSKGIYLAAGPGGGSVTIFPPTTYASGASLDLSTWYAVGTQGDVVDVLYVQ
jgi:hypothetical protein